MDEALCAWLCLIVVFIIWCLNMWRATLVGQRYFWLRQWYFWLLLFFGFLQARSLYDYFLFDASHLGFLIDEQKTMDLLKNVNLAKGGGLSDNDLRDFYMGTRLSKIASSTPFLSTIAFIVVAYHVRKLHYKLVAAPKNHPGSAVHWLLAILAMPVTLAVLAFRSWIRILSLMTGSAYLSLMQPCDDTQYSGIVGTLLGALLGKIGVLRNCGWDFQNVAKLEFRASEADLDVAAACQYFAVFCFALLCIHYFPADKTNADYIQALKYVGFLGIWSYVVLGIVQSCMNMMLSFGADFGLDTSAFLAPRNVLKSQMALCTILCVFNSYFILKIKELKVHDQLGENAITKFMATRVLLLAGTLQPLILNFILQVKDAETGKSAASLILAKYMGIQASIFDKAGHSKFQVQLWNTTLMCFWCVLVAVANVWFWYYKPAAPDRFRSQPTAPNEEPLLPIEEHP